MALNANILLYDEPRKLNTKASEEYVHVRFSYPDVHKRWDGWVPVEYRRTGVSIPVEDHQALEEHLNHIYAQMHPSLYPKWVAEQDRLWNATRSVETKEIFNILKDGRWHCRNCEISNPNFARRIQDIKEMGYTVATHTQIFYDFGKDIVPLENGISLNCSATPEHCTFAGMDSIVSPDAPEDIYISPVGCFGIVRRKRERNLKINARLEEVLLSISSEMSPEEIEKRSRVQRRGRFSTPNEAKGAEVQKCAVCAGE